MLLRDIFVSVVLLGALPICVRTPWIGVLVYSGIGYLNPHKLTWGFAYTKPWAFLAILATTVGLILGRERKHLPMTRDTVLLGILWVVFFFSTFTGALYPDDAWAQLDKVSKILFGTMITIILMQRPNRLRLLMWTIALSLGFYGFKGGIFSIATGGRHQVLGPEGTFIAGNTEIGLALNMVLPFLWLLRQDVERGWIRLSLAATSVLTIIATLATYSRGALLGLGAVLLVLMTRSRSRLLAAGLLLTVAVGTTMFLPEAWLNRMGTITNYEEDGSAMGRINAWKLAWRLAQDRPLLGAGFQPFTPEVYARYAPEVLTNSTDAHNIFFQVLAEHGFIGLTVFTALIVSMLATLAWVQQRCRRSADLRRLGLYGQIVEASMIGYIVGGFFLSRSYFDLFYQLIAITIVLETLVRTAARAASAPTLVPAPETAPAPPEAAYGRL